MLYEFKESDAYEFARQQGIEAKPKGEELTFKYCPYCKGGRSGQDKGTFAINLRTGAFNCKRSGCGQSGNMITLARDFDFPLSRDFEEYYRPKKRYRTLRQPDKPIEPKDPAVKYLLKRGISEEVTKRYEITSQNDNILFFPFYDENGVMVFAKFRKMDFDKTKDKNKEWCEAECKPILFGMKQCNLDNKTLIITEGQCFDGKAEILTECGWVRFEDYSGQDVLQVDERMNGSFVRPKQYIVKRHIGKMVKVAIGGNYESYTTDDHNLVFVDKSGEIIKKRAIEKISKGYHIPTVISIDSNEYSEWTNDMFALYIAISADGTIDYRKNTGWRKSTDRYVRIALSLKRKQDRLRGILNNLGITYSDTLESRGYASICFHCPEWLKSKFLPYDFATKTTVEQKRFIISEMTKWDGNTVKGRNQAEYTTVIKHNADVMQLIASSCGYMSTIRTKRNGGNCGFKNSYCYVVSVLFGKHNVSTQQFEKHKEVEEVDQRVYCVTVDTGMILVRQNNRISVSGNCDSLSVAEAGIENAVSVPTGSNGFTWIPYCWDWIQNFEKVIVFGDHEKGYITLFDTLSRRLPMPVYHVREDDYGECKDANEILLKYGKERIRECIEKAVLPPIKHVISLADVRDINPFDIEKLPTGFKDLDRLLYGGLPFGNLVVMTGKAGLGKSTVASQIIVNAIATGHRCFAYSGELPNHLFKSWMVFQIAGKSHVFAYKTKWGDTGFNVSETNRKLIDEWIRELIDIYDSTSITDEETISLIKIVEESISRNGTEVILIDNLMTAIDLEQQSGEDKYDKQSKFVKKLARIAQQYEVLIILVAHMRKNNNSTNGNDEVAGASDITNLASVTLMYDRSKDNEDQRYLKVWKNRLFGKVNNEGWLMSYSEESKRVYGEHDNPNIEYGWTKNIPQDDFVAGDDEDIPF